MNNITLNLKLEMLIPILNTFRQYFDNKYPCTTEENDGANMPIEDECKLITYNWLLSTYENFKDISVEAYNEFQKKVSEVEVP